MYIHILCGGRERKKERSIAVLVYSDTVYWYMHVHVHVYTDLQVLAILHLCLIFSLLAFQFLCLCLNKCLNHRAKIHPNNNMYMYTYKNVGAI